MGPGSLHCSRQKPDRASISREDRDAFDAYAIDGRSCARVPHHTEADRDDCEHRGQNVHTRSLREHGLCMYIISMAETRYTR